MLFEAGEKRIKPGRDEHIEAGWNGWLTREVVLASRVSSREAWVRTAGGAGDFVLTRMWNGQKLRRAHQDGKNRIEGFVEDYGDFAAGLTALYQACFEARYLEAAEAIVDRAVELFWDEGKQAYRMAPRDQRDLFTVPFALHDTPFPSGPSPLTQAQGVAAALTGRPAHWEQAGQYLRKLRDEMARNPFAYGHLLLAADTWLDGAADVALVGSGEEVKPF